MRSGKPPAPWRRKKARAISGVRIAVLCVVFALAAALALYRLRPLPLPWHAVGSERIVTPAFDIADADTRGVALRFTHHRLAELGGRSLIEECRPDAPIPGETYLLLRTYVSSHSVDSTRTLVTLGAEGGEVIVEDDGYSGRPGRSRRRLDAGEAEAFRTLLLDAGYPRMPASVADEWAPPRRGDADRVSLQSCLHGRFYGVVRESSEASEALQDLAARIEAFALEPDEKPR